MVEPVVCAHLSLVSDTVNDKSTMRFFYNLGIEYYKHLTTQYGHAYVMGLMDGPLFEQTPSELDAPNQLAVEFGQMTFDGSDPDVHQSKGPNVREHPKPSASVRHVCRPNNLQFNLFSNVCRFCSRAIMASNGAP